MKLLISGGGTREPIDGVRFITNFSTGATAAALADFFVSRGDEVTCLMAEGSVRPRASAARVVEYTSFDSLDRAFRTELSHAAFDAILHLAAVSDYSVDSIWEGDRRIDGASTGKLDSRGEITLKLKPNFKIVARLKGYVREALPGGRVPAVVAFKLTDSPQVEARLGAVNRLFEGSDVDWVVHNDIGDRRAGCPKFTVYGRELRALAECADAQSLGGALAALLHRSQQEEE